MTDVSLAYSYGDLIQNESCSDDLFAIQSLDVDGILNSTILLYQMQELNDYCLH